MKADPGPASRAVFDAAASTSNCPWYLENERARAERSHARARVRFPRDALVHDTKWKASRRQRSRGRRAYGSVPAQMLRRHFEGGGAVSKQSIIGRDARSRADAENRPRRSHAIRRRQRARSRTALHSTVPVVVFPVGRRRRGRWRAQRLERCGHRIAIDLGRLRHGHVECGLERCCEHRIWDATHERWRVPHHVAQEPVKQRRGGSSGPA